MQDLQRFLSPSHFAEYRQNASPLSEGALNGAAINSPSNWNFPYDKSIYFFIVAS